MAIKRVIGLLSLLALTACQGAGQSNTAAQNIKPKESAFSFFTPKALPVRVTFVVGE